jgi:heme/copper-type cytochrome/quinol oxidase subunit 2
MVTSYAENWRWVPDVVRVAEGTRLVIDFVSWDASHSFVLKAYGLKVPLPERSEKRIEFVADKKGEFKWRCGRPCGDGCAKMKGKLIVE